MINWLKRLWQGSALVEFESSSGLPDSVERLRAATRRSAIFAALGPQQAAAGTVKESRVSLQRVIPMVGNSFKPFFRGRFIERNGKAVLVGRFTVHPFAKVFMALWFGFAGLASVLAMLQGQKRAFGLLSGFGLIIAFGAAFVGLCRWFARNDAAWLSDVICRALGAQTVDQPAPTEMRTPGVKRLPTSLKLITALLALMGVMSCIGAISGVQSAYTGPNGLAVFNFPGMSPRYVTAGLGILMLALAFGVYRRCFLAWRAGLVFLAASWAYSVPEMLAMSNPRMGLGMSIVLGVLSLIVTIVWMRWWYLQRVNFDE